MKIWLTLGAIYIGFFFWYTDLGGKLTQEEIQGFIKKQEQNIIKSPVLPVKSKIVFRSPFETTTTTPKKVIIRPKI